MAEHIAKIYWLRKNEEKFLDVRYSRAHKWAFDGGAEVPASSSPHVVPLPMSEASAVDPEEAFGQHCKLPYAVVPDDCRQARLHHR